MDFVSLLKLPLWVNVVVECCRSPVFRSSDAAWHAHALHYLLPLSIVVVLSVVVVVIRFHKVCAAVADNVCSRFCYPNWWPLCILIDAVE